MNKNLNFIIRLSVAILFLFSALITLYPTLSSSLSWLNWGEVIPKAYIGYFIWIDFLLMLIVINPSKNIKTFLIQFISSLFIVSAFGKLYPTPMYGITKIFEEGQLISIGFSADFTPYFSRVIIGVEFFLALAILQRNLFKKIILPATIFLLILFCFHLVYQVFLGDSENCGCFGDLIPMTPWQALIKNIISIVILFYVYKNTEKDNEYNFSKLSFQLLTILLFIFAFVPVQTSGKNKRVSAFSKYVISDININEGRKILAFFDAGCPHCMDAAKSLNQLSDSIAYFPQVHIIFSDLEADRIPEFFEYAGREYSYQILPFYNDDDEINSYLEILGFEYSNPAIIYLDNGNQMRFYDGTGANAFPSTYFKDPDDENVIINDFTQAEEFIKLFK